MNISSCQLLFAETMLKQPYVLSFATVKKIASVIVRLYTDNGAVGIAEAVALPGYSHETTASIISDLQQILPNLVNTNTEEIESFLTHKFPDSPFAVSAVLTAKEFAMKEYSLDEPLNIPLVAPVSASSNAREALEQALNLYEHGYRTIKLKVGRDITHDCNNITLLLDELPKNTKIRIDANQGFTFKQACCFLEKLKHPRNHLIECLEQPFGINKWQDFQEFVAYADHVVPLMLDESIVHEDDVERAAAVGADLIKLKLFKHRGIKGLISLVTHAQELGLKVIFGNGVASEIGNLAEAIAFQQSNLFIGASEGNGFAKLSQHILLNPPREIHGNLIWEKAPGENEPMTINENDVQIIQEV